jgi:inosine-uridine nucleoside N-ribohydrolase
MLTDARRLSLTEPPAGRVPVVIDTDTYNEIDDQFALAHALLAPERFAVEALYAAPFHNSRSSGPGDGMERSYEEILRVLDRLAMPDAAPVFRGSADWLPARDRPVVSPAAEDLVARAHAEREGPLYVLAIGAITNVASALLLDPSIAERIVVVWLAGHPTAWHHAWEFNIKQDHHASRVMLDCGAPLVLVPCLNVAEHLRTTDAELDRFLRGRGAIGDYLCDIFASYDPDRYARSKEVWDLAPVAWMLNPAWVETVATHSPILSPEMIWSRDPRRHLIREAITLDRDAIFADFFRRVERHTAGL